MAEKTTQKATSDKTAAEALGVPLEKQFPILEYFRYEHLPNEALRDRAKPFCELARDYAARGAKNPAELAAGLRKLLEAKDCFIRAVL